MPNERNFIIWAPDYDEQRGGALVLHYLCHLINTIGRNACIWHKNEPPPTSFIRAPYSRLKAAWLRRNMNPYITSPWLMTPLATISDLHDAIVVYPEVTDGNPLRARAIVRWFLHKPGYHTGRINYGRDELYFYYQKAFDAPELSSTPTRRLSFLVILGDTFRQTNFGARSGTCYILRKGKQRPGADRLGRGIVVDGLPNKEIARIFNESEYCVSYDLHTFYSQYAALCGCKSIVVPDRNLDKEEWVAEPEFRYGIAYGEDDLERAIATVPDLRLYLTAQEESAIDSVRQFILTCDEFFA